MKKPSLIVVSLLLVVGSFTAVVFLPGNAGAATLYVGGTGPGNYTAIQDAVGDAFPGDNIYVFNGAYSEHITVYKTLSLVGESSDNTIIDGGGIGTAIYVTASGVNITGFKVTNSGSHIDDAGLKIDSVGNCYVAYNNLSSNSGNAILLLSSSVNTISRNIISDNDVGIASLYSVINTIDGNVFMDNWLSIELFRSLGDTVTNNTISDSDLGVYLYDSEDIVVLNNSMIRSGILIEGYNLASWDSHTIDTSNTVNGKPVYYWKNVSGGSVPSDAGQVILANCTRVAIENQTLSNGSVGILLGFSWENTIANNTLSSNKHSGVMLESSTNNIVASNKVSNGYFGIYSFFSSNNNTFVNNTIFSNNTAGTDVYMIGFYLYSSHYSTISNNRIFDTWIGIYPNFSTNNTISDNVASNNSLGIFLGSSVMCTVINNTMMESGIYLDGDSINHWNTHTIDATNSVNGKPVYYLKNATGGTIPAGSGEVILGNSSGVVIENQNLSDGSVGIELGFSWNNVITNNTVSSNNWEGIALHSSDGNIIANNTASANEYYGIHIAASRSNEVRSNRMASNGISISGDSLIQWNSHTIDTSNTVNGNPVYYWKDITGGTIPLDAGQVILANCRLVEIENQNLSDGSVGILLGFSHNNMIANNTASSNSQEAILLYSSDGNTLVNNTLSNNGMGIYLVFSDGNAIYHNSFINSSEQALDIGDFNQWDDGYPSGGNYWSDYAGEDDFSGPTQDQPGSDGIGDTPYPIVLDNQDMYPLMYPYGIVPPGPPAMADATLSGNNLENVTIIWSLSLDDGMGLNSVVGYKIFRSTTFDPGGLGYGLIASLPNQTSTYVDELAGEGDPNDYFYRVCAFDVDNITICTENQAGKFTRPLSRGPNLVSIPLIQSDESVESVLGTVRFNEAWYYDSPSREWESYMKSKSYHTLDHVNHTMGVWINVTEDSNLTMAGIVPAQIAIHLHEGWNLVSFPSFKTSYAVADLKAEVGATRTEGFESSNPPYCLKVLGDTDILVTGYGYWIKMETDTVWILEID